MPMKAYTHAKGFNVTSLQGRSVLYLFRDRQGKLIYIGKSEDDFKDRITSNCYGKSKKLTSNIQYITVVIVDKSIYPLYVLEHLFIWCFLPPENNALWLFGGNDEDEIIKVAENKKLYITGSVKDFIQSFESITLEREWEDKTANKYKRYGDQEELISNKVNCNGKRLCLCFKCLIDKQSVRWKRRKSKKINTGSLA
ncbi:GIY-YIG nuclease family protein [Fictibacillus sp. FJAT-27399]|uniref:GIY-YIG nuclease family protein n=1 Tax=Fictibacillus sp. FJAT-27399 TaxID=1729689 RepID=UPI000783A5C2|nr:GIY-YIG nuclease family protein [Fictibacillus sp. FJAT-27399]